MSWSNEIFRAFWLAFGIAETITNITYLVRKNGIANAYKQHRELPGDISENKMRVKVTVLLIFGIIFFTVSLLSYILRTFLYVPILICMILFTCYSIIEALYYRYWRTYCFSLLAVILLIVYLIF